MDTLKKVIVSLDTLKEVIISKDVREGLWTH